MPEGEEPVSELLHLSQPTLSRRLMQLVGNWEQSCSKGAEDMTFVTLSPPIENGTVLVRKKGADIFGSCCCLH